MYTLNPIGSFEMNTGENVIDPVIIPNFNIKAMNDSSVITADVRCYRSEESKNNGDSPIYLIGSDGNIIQSVSYEITLTDNLPIGNAVVAINYFLTYQLYLKLFYDYNLTAPVSSNTL